jgi:catechol 2,3-dioxygenase-like lactoylglutathione lyase family enzyme
MLIGYWHFSFTVADIERSVAFYTNVIGMELVHTQEQHNEYIGRNWSPMRAHIGGRATYKLDRS